MSLVPYDRIEALAQAIVEQFQPDRIYLFGSYAYGDPTEDSDLDVLVVMPVDEMELHQTALNIRLALKQRPDCDLDLIVRSTHQYETAKSCPDGFLSTIQKYGRQLFPRQAA